MEAMVGLLLEKHAATAFDAVKTFSGDDFGVLLTQLAGKVDSADHFALYCRVLDHMAHHLPPRVLLDQLPEAGSAAFFLPYIQTSLRRSKAAGVRQAIVNDAKRLAARQVP